MGLKSIGSDLIRFFFSWAFWLNLLLAIIIVLVGVWVTFYALDDYTHKGETVTVPDLRGLTLEEAQYALKNKSLRFSVLDSTYVVNALPKEVLGQEPEAWSKVKENRKIYLTINAINPPDVKMPNLKDKSLRQARLELESKGLKVGELIYKPDMALNAVLDQLYQDQPIEANAMVPKGSKIDLVLGNGYGQPVTIPNLQWQTLEQVVWKLDASYLNLGFVQYDETVEDTSTAVVYKQIPAYNENAPGKLSMGAAIDIFMTQSIPDSLVTDTSNVEIHDN